MPLIEAETHTGQPVQAGLVKITPFSKAYTLRLPGLRGNSTWNWLPSTRWHSRSWLSTHKMTRSSPRSCGTPAWYAPALGWICWLNA